MSRLRRHSAQLALIFFFVVNLGAGLWIVRTPRSVDFAVYYLAARATQQGTNIYTLTDLQWLALAQQHGVPEVTPPFRYPPFALALVLPYASASYQTALLIWTGLSVLALLISGLALSKTLRGRWIDPVVFVALALYVPVLTTIYAGQANNFVLASLALYLLFATRRQLLAGLSLATGIMIKPLAAPLVLHQLWRRSFRLFVNTLVGLIIVVAVGTLLAGPATSVNYVENAWQLSTLGGDTGPVTYPPNQSLYGFFGRLLTTHPYGSALADNPALARWLWLGTAALLVLGVAYLTWPRSTDRTATLALETGLILVTINLIVPTSWYHHTVIALIPIVASWHAARSTRPRIVLVIAFGLIDAQGVLWHQLEGDTLLLSLGTYGLLLVYAVTAYMLWQAQRTLKTERGNLTGQENLAREGRSEGFTCLS